MKNRMIFAIGLMLPGLAVPVSAQQISLAEVARRAREHRNESPRAKRVYSNDDLAHAGPVSVIGSPPPSGNATSANSPAVGATTAVKPADKTKDPAASEAAWRKKFAELRDKISIKAKEIDVTQRELNLKQQQYYSDPNVAMREQYSRNDINDSKTRIDDMKKELEGLRQQLSDLEDQLRREGLPASWARE